MMGEEWISRFFLKFLPREIRNKLTNNQAILSILSNSGWLLFDKLIRMLLGLFVGAWVARYLGPEEYGSLAFVLAYLAFFQTISLLGMDGIVVREISKDNNKVGEILGTVFFLRAISGLVCWLSAITFMGVMNGWGDRSVYITILAGATLIFQSADTIDLWFQSQSQSRRTVLAKLVAYILSNGVKITLILYKAPLIAFAAVIAFDALTAALGLIYAYKFFPCNRPWRILKSQCKKLLNESWPFVLSGLSIVVYMRIDQIMIKELIGDKDLGIYAAVLPLSMLWTFIPATLSVSFAPLVTRKKVEGEMAYAYIMNNLFRGFSFLGWMICIPISLLSPFIVDILFGQNYNSGIIVLSIIIFTNLFINMGVAQSLWILNEGKSKLSLYKTLLGAIVCVISNFILIPAMGIVGAAISSVLSQAVSAVFSNVFLCRKIFYLQIRSIFLIKGDMNRL